MLSKSVSSSVVKARSGSFGERPIIPSLKPPVFFLFYLSYLLIRTPIDPLGQGVRDFSIDFHGSASVFSVVNQKAVRLAPQSMIVVTVCRASGMLCSQTGINLAN
jgi:hypothetical protein